MSNGTSTGVFSDTTLTIDYTTGVVTGGPLTFSGNGDSFSSFSLRDVTVDGVTHYILTATGAAPGQFVELNWAGTAPTSFGALSLVEPGGYDHFVSDNVTPGVCFAAGTLIRTPAGDVPVETLTVGDLVLTASGQVRPVKWMGHKEVDFRVTPRGSPGLPIRIAADAFGHARPSQDLYLSTGHAICVDLLGEVFIPVGYLVNGGTIAEVEVDTIGYWHVELDSHDILIANNLPAESYLAMANRGAFEELRGRLPATMEGRERTHADFCRPVVTEGPVLDFVRQRLLARAEEIGWTSSRDADLHLVVDGDIVRPSLEGSVATFDFPASARDVRLVSNTFSPKLFNLKSDDPRMLGVMLCGLALGDRELSLEDERLRDGVHQLENHGGGLRRWTNGELVLDSRLWDGLSGQVALRVTYDPTTVRGWTAPASAPKAAPVARPKLRAVA